MSDDVGNWFTNLLTTKDVARKPLAVVAVVSGAALFSPESLLKTLRLDAFLAAYGAFGGVAFLATTALLALDGAQSLWSLLRSRRVAAESGQRAKQRLKSLDTKEQAVMREFWMYSQNTLQLPIDHPVVAGLLADGILVPVGSLGERIVVGTLFSVTIADFLKDEVRGADFGIPAGEPTAEEEQWLLDNRPDFARRLQEYRNLKMGRFPF